MSDPTDEPICHNSKSESHSHSITTESEVGAGTTISEVGLATDFRGDGSKKAMSRNHDDDPHNKAEKVQRDQEAERTQASEARDMGQNAPVVEAWSGGRSPLC